MKLHGVLIVTDQNAVLFSGQRKNERIFQAFPTERFCRLEINVRGKAEQTKHNRAS
jgi:hypothetical protein